ncbi:BON domain-containing protein [Streptomyces filipinensis]|uniref:BON domain-containing protein n=1 Tax=Streptomyces filipinensis TaxID=66887 RepID=UPI0036E9A366
MTAQAVTVAPDAILAHAARAMARSRVKRLPVVVRLCGTSLAPVGVEVHDGVVTFTGCVDDGAFVPLATLLARAVPGVVDVHCTLTGRRRHPDPDLADPHHTSSA